MYKSFSRQRFIGVLVACISLSASYISATNWTGGDITCAQSNIDTNFTISGVNNIIGPVVVQASTVDVGITVGAGAVLKSDNTDAGRIFISSDAGRTVTFNVNNDLEFRGSDNNINPLLVAFSGPGTLVFSLGNNTSVAFTSQAGTEGARFYVIMDSVNQPTVQVIRQNTNSPTNVEFQVGAQSFVTYLARSRDVSAVGTIEFDATNQNANGFMIIRVEDRSSFVIAGQEVLLTPEVCTGPSSSITFMGFSSGDVDLTTLAGRTAHFTVRNSVGGTNQGALRIINSNTQLPSFRADPFCDGSFITAGGQQPGFILGANGQITTEDLSYIDYISTSTPVCPCTPVNCLCGVPPLQVMKQRTPSALFVDGAPDALGNAVIQMNGSSGIYFRAGDTVCGAVNPDQSFVINPNNIPFASVKTPGAGQVVFDVEGMLQVIGTSPNSNALQILSLQVATTGCPIVIASEATSPDATVFPARTFATNTLGEYLRYNSGAFLINNLMVVENASIVHTDENHTIFERENLGDPNLNSEPTYIGGEAFKITCNNESRPRPAIAFENSIFRFHTDAGLTGVDLQVPNIDTLLGNLSVFRFYSNGCALDQSYGRILILGTAQGASACDGSLVDHDSHLDIIQTSSQSLVNAAAPQRLEIQVSNNDACIVEGLTAVNGLSVHTIYQGGSSNISIGTNLSVPNLPTPVTNPTLLINGEFISFETQGGSRAYPPASGTTGEGGIFVDQNGTFGIVDFERANVSTMVVKSGNAVINLPRNQVYFSKGVGITNWQINLANPNDQILIPSGQYLSQYTFDWGAALRDCANWIPYEPTQVLGCCQETALIAANLTSVPVVQGEVDQLQIRRSRLGDMVPLIVDGGFVRELVFLVGYNTAEAPMGLIALDNYAQVGLGTAARNVDSVDASIKLGINGIILAAQGDGTVKLNENIIVDNVCHILTGTPFGATQAQTLSIYSDVPREFRIKSTGCLDLSEFDSPTKIFQFAGMVKLVAEPGAQIILGSSTSGLRGQLVFTDETSFEFDRLNDPNLADQATPDDLQSILVKISGVGDITFKEATQSIIYQRAFVAIQSLVGCALATDIQFILQNQAKILIGTDAQPGGSLQIGNTTSIPGASVNFTLTLDGAGTEFTINREGFLGLGVGIASKLPNQSQDTWTGSALFNVGVIKVNMPQGLFSHRQIYLGSNLSAGLLAIGNTGTFSWTYDATKSYIRGGGNAISFALPTLSPGKKASSVNSPKKPYDNAVTVKGDSNLPLDNFSWIPAESEHAQEMHIRAESGVTMTGAQRKLKLRVYTKKVLDLRGRDLVLLSKHFTHIWNMQAKLIKQKQKSRPKPVKNVVMQLAPGKKFMLAQGLEVMNDTKQSLFITESDVRRLAELLTGVRSQMRTPASVNFIVENVAGLISNTYLASIMKSKMALDQSTQLGLPVGPNAFFNYIAQGDVTALGSPMASAAPNDFGTSTVGYVSGGTIYRPTNQIYMNNPYGNGLTGTEYVHKEGGTSIVIDEATGKVHRNHAYNYASR